MIVCKIYTEVSGPMCMGEGVVAREVTGGEIVGCAGKGREY